MDEMSVLGCVTSDGRDIECTKTLLGTYTHQ
jgi:hypothetical protein